MNRITNKLYILPMLLAIVMVMIACDSHEEIVRKTMADRRAAFVEDSLSLKVGVLPTEDCDVINLASELGIFDSLGVKVHLRHFNALSECRYALKAGVVEGAAIDSVLAKIIEESDTTKLTLVRSTGLSWKLISSKKARVLRVSQLADKMVAADSHGATHNFAEAAIDSLLKKKAQVFVVQIEDPKVRYDMIYSGTMDAAMLPEPFAQKALDEGCKLLKDYSNRPKGVLAFRSKALNDKRIKKQEELFLKGLDIAKDSLEVRKHKQAKSVSKK